MSPLLASPNDLAPPEQARIAADISFRQVAEHLDCSIQQASRYCQGENRPPDSLYAFLSIQAAASLKRRHIEWMLAHRPHQGRRPNLRIEIKIPKGMTPAEAQEVVTAAFAAAMSKPKEVAPTNSA